MSDKGKKLVDVHTLIEGYHKNIAKGEFQTKTRIYPTVFDSHDALVSKINEAEFVSTFSPALVNGESILFRYKDSKGNIETLEGYANNANGELEVDLDTYATCNLIKELNLRPWNRSWNDKKDFIESKNYALFTSGFTKLNATGYSIEDTSSYTDSSGLINLHDIDLNIGRVVQSSNFIFTIEPEGPDEMMSVVALLTEENKIYVIFNSNGDRSHLLEITGITDVKSVEIYGATLFVLKNDGSIWSRFVYPENLIGENLNGEFTTKFVYNEDKTQEFKQIGDSVNNLKLFKFGGPSGPGGPDHDVAILTYGRGGTVAGVFSLTDDGKVNNIFGNETAADALSGLIDGNSIKDVFTTNDGMFLGFMTASNTLLGADQFLGDLNITNPILHYSLPNYFGPGGINVNAIYVNENDKLVIYYRNKTADHYPPDEGVFKASYNDQSDTGYKQIKTDISTEGISISNFHCVVDVDMINTKNALYTFINPAESDRLIYSIQEGQLDSSDKYYSLYKEGLNLNDEFIYINQLEIDPVNQITLHQEHKII